MALPSSGPLSIADIAAEFGGAAPHALSEYYGAGGAPGAGALSVSDFYGLSSSPQTIYHEVLLSTRNDVSEGGSYTATINGSFKDGDLVVVYGHCRTNNFLDSGADLTINGTDQGRFVNTNSQTNSRRAVYRFLTAASSTIDVAWEMSGADGTGCAIHAAVIRNASAFNSNGGSFDPDPTVSPGQSVILIDSNINGDADIICSEVSFDSRKFSSGNTFDLPSVETWVVYPSSTTTLTIESGDLSYWIVFD